MSIATQETTTSHGYLESLQSLFENKQAALEWLVIAHDDPAMIRRLADVVSDHAAATLQIPQSRWDFGGEAMAETVNWSISSAGVRHLLLVGHSQAGPPQEAASWEAASWIGDGTGIVDPTSAVQPNYNRLLDGAKRVQGELQRSKSHFAEQVAALCDIGELNDAVLAGRLQLHTLFYVAQSGAFLIFDIVTQTFKTIGD